MRELRAARAASVQHKNLQTMSKIQAACIACNFHHMQNLPVCHLRNISRQNHKLSSLCLAAGAPPVLGARQVHLAALYREVGRRGG